MAFPPKKKPSGAKKGGKGFPPKGKKPMPMTNAPAPMPFAKGGRAKRGC